MSPVKYFFIIQVKRKPINEQKVWYKKREGQNSVRGVATYLYVLQ